MSNSSRLFHSIPVLHRKDGAEDDMAEEFRFHLECEIEKNIAAGMGAEEARYAALRRFGGVEQIKDGCRDARRITWIENIWRDFYQGLRILRSNPGLSLTIILTLALGIGANSGIFSLANTLLFRGLPFREPDRLVAVWNESQNGDRLSASGADIADWSSQSGVLEGVAGYVYNPNGAFAAALSEEQEAEHLYNIEVTRDFFTVLGVQPALGRSFSVEDYKFVRRNLFPAIITYDMWQTRFGGRTDVLGQVFGIGTGRLAVVGVMPRDFRLFRDYRPEVFVPNDTGFNRRNRFLNVIARLKSGVDLDQARAEMSSLAKRLEREYPETNRGIALRVEDLHEHLLGKRDALFMLLLGSAGLVLLIGCANIANLLLARAANREREMAVRAALGAGRWRVARLLLIENAVLALSGGLLGLLFARWGVQIFNAFASGYEMGLLPTQVDGHVIRFTLLLTLGTGILFGMAPIVHSWKSDLNAGLKGGAGRPSAQRWSGILISAEVALSLMLLALTGLLLRSLLLLSHVRPGFAVEGVLTMAISPSELNAGTASGIKGEETFWRRLLERTGEAPGVQAVALSGNFPLSSEQGSFLPVTCGGCEMPAQGQLLSEFEFVSPGYFRAMGIPLVRGRFFTERDVPVVGAFARQPVVIINEGFAREQWPAQDPLGRTIAAPRMTFTVAGVVGDVRQHGMRLNPPKRQMYAPLFFSGFARGDMHYLILRTRGDHADAVAMVRDVLRDLDPARSLKLVRTMKQVVAGNTAWDRLNSAVVTLFGILAVLLTLIGVYGVVARAVSLRTKEIGIRLALGSRPRDVVRLIVRQGMGMALLGLPPGLAAAWLGARLLSSQLFGVSPADLRIYAGVTALLLTVTLAACYLPALRATKITPVIALRCD